MDSVAIRVRKDARKRSAPGPDYSSAMRALYDWCRRGACEDEAAALAISIHDDRTQAEILEALLLSECPTGDIEQAFGVPAAATDIYKELFFNVGRLRTKLEKISYVTNYPDPFGKELKLRALNLGYEYVLYTYANIVPRTQKQRQLVKRMFMTTAYKAMAMNYSGLTSTATKAAVEHAKLMLKAFEALDRTAGDDAENDSANNLLKILAAPQPPDVGTPLRVPPNPEDIV